jgi:hypothetical protein
MAATLSEKVFACVPVSMRPTLSPVAPPSIFAMAAV